MSELTQEQAHTLHRDASIHVYVDMDTLFRCIQTMSIHGASYCNIEFKSVKDRDKVEKKLGDLGYNTWYSNTNGLHVDWC